MSFSIELGTNSSETNKLTKSVNYSQTLTGSLKNESDIVNPEIFVEGLSNIKNLNYMRINEFGRCYFIDDITIVRDGLYRIKARCDVLSSFASQIRNNTAIVKKQENHFNLYLDDGTFKAYQNPNFTIQKFSGSPFGSSHSFILAVAGDQMNAGA